MDSPEQAPQSSDAAAEEELPPYRIEKARSSRSRCRTCRRKIDKDKLRLGVLLEGPYGTGYLWHHLTCAAKRRADDVEAAYAQHCFEDELELPPIEELRALREKAEEAKKNRKQAPWVERAPTGRAKCKHCGEPMAKGSFRVALLREVQFGQQIRSAPINVHPGCVAAELLAEDCATEAEGFAEQVRANSRDLEPAEIEAALAEIGEVG
ncbi:MAG TPA: hypothetical protein ENJ09_14405 [Planctomycetes bacterium]|nr:hypothetical protein [Planctomycetota bacterium]